MALILLPTTDTFNDLAARSFAYAKVNYDIINAALLRIIWNDVFAICINVYEF